VLSSLGVASGRRIGVERSGADADVERSRDGGDVTGIQPQRTAVGHWLLQRLDEYLGFAGACCFHISMTIYLFYFIYYENRTQSTDKNKNKRKKN